jgi:ABC-2 type transport system permease protein
MTLYEHYITLITISRKEIYRFFRMWGQTIFPPLITTTLYFIIFGELIGSQLREIKGQSFINYIIPGLVMMAIITNSYINVCSSFFISKFQKSIEEILVSPTSVHVIILGFTLGGVVRSLVVGSLIVLSSSYFTILPMPNVFIFILFCVFTAILFSLAGLVNAIFADKFDDISIVPTFFLTPLSYLGGIFYSIDQLPIFWQKILVVNPIFYLINGIRYGCLGIYESNISFSFAVLFSCVIFLYLLAYILLTKGISIKS